MTADPLLVVSNLTKTFGAFTALRDVSCSVRAGEVVGLIGPNGAGKTTLFQCIAGVLPADAGQFTYDGRAIGHGAAGSHLFYLPDTIAPWPSQTVHWALRFVADFFGVNRQSLLEPISRLRLTALLGHRIGTLSKGELKRLLLAIGLLTPQELLLADEPFDGLDLRQTRDAAEFLRAGASGRRTLWLSIHQIGEAARVCDRFVLLSGGRVCGEGTLDELTALAEGRSRVRPETLEEVFLALT